ncbi:MAG: hypothetical protein QW507_00800, partial [Candidatus Nanoarchaeia archaeon]|nr:hypothetical protein [Candidatus Haiyanarchaeum thermophilum]
MIIAVAIFSFFFLYTVIFVASVQLEIKAPTKNVADRIYEMLLSSIFQLPITISSNTEIWNEAFEVLLELEFDKNSTILKGSSLIPSRFVGNILVFPLNSTRQIERLTFYFTKNTSREARNYVTDLQAVAFPQSFQINNAFFSAKVFENCSFPELKSGNLNVFLEGIMLTDHISSALLDNVLTQLSCNYITYRFFPSTPKIRVLSSIPINLSLQSIFTHWSTHDSEGSIDDEQSFRVKKLLLYNHSSKLLFIEFDAPTLVVLRRISQFQVAIYNATSTTTITSGWTNPTYAYAPDNLRTYTSTSGAEQEYSGYGINIPSGATINKVWVGLEGYTTDAAYEELYVKIYDGTAWYTKIVTDYSSETLQWIDFTTSTTWTPEKVNSIKTRILYYYTGGGGGCYPNFTKAIVYS